MCFESSEKIKFIANTLDKWMGKQQQTEQNNGKDLNVSCKLNWKNKMVSCEIKSNLDLLLQNDY